MTEQEQAVFDGWAIVDVLGHQRYVGHVRTQAFGQAVLFRVDVPSLPEREYVLTRPESASGSYCPAGSKVRRAESPGYTKLIGAGSIYTISPCTEAAAMAAIEANQSAPLTLIDLPAVQLSILAVADKTDDPELGMGTGWEDDDQEEDRENYEDDTPYECERPI